VGKEVKEEARMRKREGLRPRHLAFAVLLLLPPAARIVERALAGGDGPDELEALRLELAAAGAEARRARLELEAQGFLAEGSAGLPRGHELLAADALPLSDPSPARSTLWALVRGPREPPASGAALARGALAGRVLRAFADLAIVKVQTVLDPAFRARFRQKGASGMLWGTGRSVDGHALLEVRHLSQTVDLAPGEPVFTEGSDGVYPGGILIGFVAGAETARGAKRVLVRSAVRVEDAERIDLAVDAASPRLSEALRRDAAAGGLGFPPAAPSPPLRAPPADPAASDRRQP
jgi:hypothetical protein